MSQELLSDFPALEPVVDQVRMVNGTVESAELYDNGDGLGLHISFVFGGGAINFSFLSMGEIGSLFKIAGVSNLRQLAGRHVRVEFMSQGSWCPFFRIWHIVDNENWLIKYEEASLKRFARGERV